MALLDEIFRSLFRAVSRAPGPMLAPIPERGGGPTAESRWRTGAWGALGLALLTLLFFHRAVAGGCFFQGDFLQMFVPLRAMLAGGDGTSLLWAGRLNNGIPVLADAAQGALYPPNLLFRLTDPSPGLNLFPSARLLTLLAIAHQLWGACGAWFLARRWGRSAAGAWVTAIVFGFGGLGVSAMSSVALAWTCAWLPWLLLAGEAPSAAGLAVVVMMMGLQGEPFAIAPGLLMLGSLVAFGPHAPRRRALVTLAAVATGLLLASPLIYAVLRYLPASVRAAGFEAEGIFQWSFHPWTALGFLVPGAFGDPRLHGLAGFWGRALVPGRDHLLFPGLYLGGLTIALAVGGALRAAPRGGSEDRTEPARRERLVVVWLAVLVLLALGRYGPAGTWMAGLPGFDAFRYPVKWLASAMLPLALLAGRGLDRLAAAEPGDDRSMKEKIGPLLPGLSVLVVLAAIALATLLPLGPLVAWLTQVNDGSGRLASLIGSRWLAGALRSALPLGTALAALVVLRRSAGIAARGALIAALVTLDLGLANARLAPTAPASLYRMTPTAARAVLGDPAGHGRLYVEELAAARMTFSDPPRTALEFADWQRQALQFYAGAGPGLDLAFNPDIEAFSTAHYARLRALVDGAPLREKLMLLGAAGVTHLATFDPLDDPRLRPVASLPGRLDRPLVVYRNALALPRARVVPALTTYKGNRGFIDAVRGGPDDLFARTALVDGERGEGGAQQPGGAAGSGEAGAAGAGPGDVAPGAEPRASGSATIAVDAGHRLVILVSGAGGTLVVSDSMAPGWRASVDGRPAPMFRADYAFRAVAIPAGEHTVEMTYRP